MARLFVLGITIGLALVPRGGSAAEPAGTAFTYQGRLIQSGRPFSGSADLRFALFTSADGNVQVGDTETVDNVGVSAGLFAVQLDFGDSVFTGDARWLAVSVRSTHDPNDAAPFNALSPRQPLTAVPYALHALSTDGHSLDAADGDPIDVVVVNDDGTVVISGGSNCCTDGAFACDDPDCELIVAIEERDCIELGWSDDCAQLARDLCPTCQVLTVDGKLRVTGPAVVQGELVISQNQSGLTRLTLQGATTTGRLDWDSDQLRFETTQRLLVNGLQVHATPSFPPQPYSQFGTGMPVSGFISTNEDVFVSGDLETGGRLVCEDLFVNDDLRVNDHLSVGGNIFVQQDGKVGIGTSDPQSTLDVRGDIFVGQGGALKLAGSSTSSWVRMLGDHMSIFNFNVGDLRLGTSTLVGNGSDRLTIKPDGKVGISHNNPDFRLHVNGDAGKPGGGTWSVASDRRLKKNIRGLTGALDRLLRLRGVAFEYKDPEAICELPGQRMGMVAQEVEHVFPDWVDSGRKGYKRVTFRGFEALTVEALRELRAEKDAQLESLCEAKDTQIANLMKENKSIRARLARIENLVTKLVAADGGASEPERAGHPVEPNQTKGAG